MNSFEARLRGKWIFAELAAASNSSLLILITISFQSNTTDDHLISKYKDICFFLESVNYQSTEVVMCDNRSEMEVQRLLPCLRSKERYEQPKQYSHCTSLWKSDTPISYLYLGGGRQMHRGSACASQPVVLASIFGLGTSNIFMINERLQVGPYC